MHNLVLSPICPEDLVDSISKKVTANLLQVMRQEKIASDHDQLLTISEAASFLSLSVPTIYSKVSKGEIPFMKQSKRLYFSRQELTDYIKKGRKKTNAEVLAEADAYLKK